MQRVDLTVWKCILPVLVLSFLAACGTTDGLTGRIAVSSDLDGDWEVFVADLQDGIVQQVTDNLAYDWQPIWSPDGSRFIIESNYLAGETEQVEESSADGLQLTAREKTGPSGVVILNADGSGRTRLTREQTMEEHPSWSPDGEKVLFVSYQTGNSEIFMRDIDGSNLRQLTDDPGEDLDPAWSVDGSQITFSSSRSENFNIYVMDLDGGNIRQLTKGHGIDRSPAWSPDGKQVAFASRRADNWDIYIVDAHSDGDGENARSLTDDPDADLAPVWSPDGRHLVFASDRSGSMEVYSIGADGAGVQRLGIEGIPSDWING